MLKHGILGLLNYGNMTGYEIMEVFRDSLNYFWNAQTSQIYRELQTLKKNGFVTDTAVNGRGGEKKIFSITESGKEELIRWLRSEQDLGVRMPLLMVTFFRGELPVEENLYFFNGIKEFSRQFQENMQAPDKKTKSYSELIDSNEKALYWQMTIEFGKMYSRMIGEWADKCIAMLQGANNEDNKGDQK